MKILLVYVLLFPFHTKAQDNLSCASKFVNLTLAIKARSHMLMELEPVIKKEYKGNLPENYKNPMSVDDPRITVDKVCSSGDSSFWEESKKQKKLSLKLIGQEIKTKGKVSKTLIEGIVDVAEKDMTQKELCAYLEKQTKDAGLGGEKKCHDLEQNIVNAFSSSNYLDKSYSEACAEIYPKLKNYYSKMSDCNEGNKAEVVQTKNKTQDTDQNFNKREQNVKGKAFKYLNPGATPQ